MNFTRTRSGLLNEHLFFNVDHVVYVEGGKSRNLTDVVRGGHDIYSDDIRFWRTLFEVYLPTNKYKFKAVGGKGTLLQVAERLSGSNSLRTIVAMDRDFDTHTGKALTSPFVLYTYGYSWENDLWQKEVLCRVYRIFCPGCPHETDVDNEVDIWWKRLTKDLRWPVYGDYYLIGRHHSFQGIRGAHGRLLVEGADGCPILNIPQLRTDFRVAKSSSTKPTCLKKPVKLDGHLDCYGHFFDSIVSTFLAFLLRSRCTRRVQYGYEILHSAAAEVFKHMLENKVFAAVNAHYDKQFARLSLN